MVIVSFLVFFIILLLSVNAYEGLIYLYDSFRD